MPSSRTMEERVTRQIMAHLARGPDLSMLLRQEEEKAEKRKLEIRIPAPKPIRIPIHKEPIRAFDWARVQILSEHGLESRW